MKVSFNNLIRIVFLALGLSLHSETVTVLESFEDNVDNLVHSTDDPADNPSTNRRVIGFSQSEDNASGRISHGDKALKVEFSGMSGWQRDFQVILNREATEALQEAVHSEEIGRYFLAYEISWDTLNATIDWANQPLEIGGWQYGDQIEWNGSSEPITMAYELAGGIPEGFNLQLNGDNGDQTFIGFIFNGNTADPVNVYVDHIRLIDTKPAGAETLVTVLNSFEEAIDAITVQGRTEGPQSNSDPAFISHGSRSAVVTLTGDGGWATDLSLKVASSVLADVLELPQDQRYRYSLAWDWFAKLSDNAGADWFQQSVFPNPPGLQLTQPWAGDAGMRTRVINLGMVDWNTPPEFSLTHNSNWSGGDLNIYIDNIRLIDQGYVPNHFNLTGVSHSQGTFAFSWNTSPGKVYRVFKADSMTGDWSQSKEITASGDTIQFEDPSASDQAGFYQVLNVPAPPVFEEDFESGAQGWTTHVLATGSSTQWELGTPASGQGPGSAHGGTHVYGTDLDADYEFNTSIALRSPVIDLTGLQAATLLFWSYQDVEPLFEGAFVDFVEVYILDANGNDLLGSAARRRSGSNDDWSQERLRLPTEALGKSIRIEFRMTSDSFNAVEPSTGTEVTQAGWFIDDVAVIAE